MSGIRHGLAGSSASWSPMRPQPRCQLGLGSHLKAQLGKCIHFRAHIVGNSELLDRGPLYRADRADGPPRLVWKAGWLELKCGGLLHQQAPWVLLPVQTPHSARKPGPDTFGALTWDCSLVVVVHPALSNVCVPNVLREVHCHSRGTCVSDV